MADSLHELAAEFRAMRDGFGRPIPTAEHCANKLEALAARQDSEVAALRETLKRVESLIPFWERLQLAHADDAASLIDQGQHKAYGACAHNLRAAISEDSRHG